MTSRPGARGDSAWLRLTAEHVTARALLETPSLTAAAPKILEAICEFFGWDHGALWTLDREANVLRCAQLWTARGAYFPKFDAASQRTAFPEGVGLPGRVWATREPIWIPDVVHDTNFPRAPIAAAEGLHAALGFPILLQNGVAGVMEFFSGEIRQPDASMLGVLATVGSQIGLFLERRKAQEDLDRFFTLSLDLLCIAGYDGYFKRVNPSWQRVLGYTEHELLSQPYMNLVHPDDRAATVASAEQLVAGKDVIHFENRYLHKDGTYRWLLWMVSTAPEQQAVYGSARDITERKAADETLAQLIKELEVARRKAEEATEAKGAFLANMSHEIRTPLNAILGMTTLALQTRLSADQREYLTAVRVAGDSLLAIVNDVLDFSKIEARRLELERTEFELRETVGDAARMLAPRAGEKHVELAVHIAPNAPDVLVGDPGRLRQVLLNVIGNAVKFTNRGEVVVDVEVESVAEDEVRLHFSVRDTGIGIPPEKQQQIFQAFTQVDSSTTRRFGGTGLGLAIALRLVELMHGRMWVESAAGRGSTFHFTAAFERPSAEAAKRPPRGPVALDGLRVLVVDDNATNRLILEEMLASWHMKPRSVADAEAALEALRGAAATGTRFDVVVSDCQMPDVDGFTLAKRIKHEPQIAATPIVMLTSMARADDAARCRKLGIETCLTKPVKHSDLLDALATLFDISTRRPRPEAKPKLAAAAKRRLRVLLAEDNAVNRKLVIALLKKRGHEVKAVENGRQAVDALESPRDGHFDVVLMDLQMPVMGGFEATKAVRDSERPGGRRVPIIALTAHAMQGDRERCIAAGMDGYVSKPIDVAELLATVERFGSPAREAQAADAPRATESGSDALAFDEHTALAHTANDPALLRQLIAMFNADRAASLQRIQTAIRKRDAEALRMAAHAIKGPLGTLGARVSARITAELEQMGRVKTLDGANDALSRLRSSLDEFDKALGAAGYAGKAKPAKRSAAKTAKRRRT